MEAQRCLAMGAGPLRGLPVDIDVPPATGAGGHVAQGTRRVRGVGPPTGATHHVLLWRQWHGGPANAFGFRYLHEAQRLAAARAFAVFCLRYWHVDGAVGAGGRRHAWGRVPEHIAAPLATARRLMYPERPLGCVAKDPALDTWLKAAKAVFLAEGFKRDPKAFRKPGQVWSLVRQEEDDMQTHIRAFSDGRLESEVELSNKFIQHLWSHRRGAHEEVAEILDRHGMPTMHVNETFVPITGTKEGKVMPNGRTKNHHAAFAVVVGIGLMLGRAYLKRTVLKLVPGKR